MELQRKGKEQCKVYFPLTTLSVKIITINHQIEIDLLIGDK